LLVDHDAAVRLPPVLIATDAVTPVSTDADPLSVDTVEVYVPAVPVLVSPLIWIDTAVPPGSGRR